MGADAVAVGAGRGAGRDEAKRTPGPNILSVAWVQPQPLDFTGPPRAGAGAHPNIGVLAYNILRARIT